MSADKASRGVPAWVWVGCGCAGAIGALVALAVGLGIWGIYQAREFGESMADPGERRSKALEVLGASELPAGYHAVVAFSVPFVFDAAILSDVPPDESGRPSEIGEKGFLYLSFPGFGQQERELRDFFEGRTEDLESLRRQRFDLDLEERVAEGTLTRQDEAILWVTHRGRVDPDDSGRSKEGLVTLVLFDCDDSRQRLGIWFGPDPAPQAAASELDLADTVGDPRELERFLEPIHPCS